MTVGGWIIFCILSVIAFVVCLGFGYTILDEKGYIVGTIVAIPICICILFGMLWWYGQTESGKRAMKTQESNFEGGINRSVKIYDAIGNLLEEYQGRFDVDFDGDKQRILFDDENNKRHVIYFKTGTIIVEEI